MTRFWIPAALATLSGLSLAQDVTPDQIVSDPSDACGGGSESHTICITLPDDTVIDTVDVFLLFDDTGSFAGQVPRWSRSSTRS